MNIKKIVVRVKHDGKFTKLNFRESYQQNITDITLDKDTIGLIGFRNIESLECFVITEREKTVIIEDTIKCML